MTPTSWNSNQCAKTSGVLKPKLPMGANRK
jgi:hypothetical protein